MSAIGTVDLHSLSQCTEAKLDSLEFQKARSSHDDLTHKVEPGGVAVPVVPLRVAPYRREVETVLLVTPPGGRLTGAPPGVAEGSLGADPTPAATLQHVGTARPHVVAAPER